MHGLAVYLLSNVPGLPPIVQTVHLLGIFTNPVFGLKFALLLPSIALAALLHVVTVRKPDYRGTKVIAACSLLLWIGVVLAGRWIAYADYLFPEE